MSYTRTHWVESETPLSADNFNNIEDGIEELQDQKVDKVTGKGLSTNDYTTAEKNKLTNMLSLVYPVGSIYMSVNSTNPGTLFGGTWVAWGSGRVPVGVDTSDADFNTVEETGGAKSHSYTPAGTNSGGSVQNHTLTIAEMPSHSHTTSAYFYKNSAAALSHYAVEYRVGESAINTSSVGGGGAHNHGLTQPTFTGTAATMNHLQPYITCYMWKRTA